jgi:hypothetical protein
VEAKGPLSQKINPGHVFLILIVLAVPAFFWFRFLYHRFVVEPDQVSPQMAKMRDAMMQRSRPGAAVSRPAAPPKASADTHPKMEQTEATKAAH